MEQNRTTIAVKNYLGLFRRWGIGRAAIALVIAGTAKLAFQPYPGRGYHTAGLDLLCLGRPFLHRLFTIFF